MGLEVAVDARHHEHLLVLLRALHQRVGARLQLCLSPALGGHRVAARPRGHEEPTIAPQRRALGSGGCAGPIASGAILLATILPL